MTRCRTRCWWKRRPDASFAGASGRAAAIDREVQRLNRIVANLLDLSRIEGGALRALGADIERV